MSEASCDLCRERPQWRVFLCRECWQLLPRSVRLDFCGASDARRLHVAAEILAWTEQTIHHREQLAASVDELARLLLNLAERRAA